MEIILNESLEPKEVVKHSLEDKLLRAINKKNNFKKGVRYEMICGETETTLKNAGLLGLISHCYSNHLPLAIAPHDLWNLLIGELLKEVAQNQEDYRHFFTDSQSKKKLQVASASEVEIPVSQLRKVLSENIHFDDKLIVQEFSTQTEESYRSLEAMLCDMASPYYDYFMFCCGITKIKLLGKIEDWENVLNAYSNIVDLFDTERLKEHFESVEPILKRFINAMKGDFDVEVWKNIFTQENKGSGRELFIDGWIIDLFIKNKDGVLKKIDNFVNAYAAINYENVDTKRDFVAVYGAFEVEEDSGYQKLKYGKYILEVKKV